MQREGLLQLWRLGSRNSCLSLTRPLLSMLYFPLSSGRFIRLSSSHPVLSLILALHQFLLAVPNRVGPSIDDEQCQSLCRIIAQRPEKGLLQGEQGATP